RSRVPRITSEPPVGLRLSKCSARSIQLAGRPKARSGTRNARDGEAAPGRSAYWIVLSSVQTLRASPSCREPCKSFHGRGSARDEEREAAVPPAFKGRWSAGRRRQAGLDIAAPQRLWTRRQQPTERRSVVPPSLAAAPGLHLPPPRTMRPPAHPAQ